MAITIANAALRLLAAASPQYVANTLAEIQPAVDLDPELYEGKYFVALDQPAGQQLYIVESAAVRAANDQEGYKFDLPQLSYYNPDGTPRAGRVGVFTVAGVTDANGQFTAYPTSDGTAGGAALFSQILSVDFKPSGIPAALQERPFDASYANTDNKIITCQFLRGMLVGIGLANLRAAAPGTPVLARIEGVIA